MPVPLSSAPSISISHAATRCKTNLEPLFDALYEFLTIGREPVDGDAALVRELEHLRGVARLDRVPFGLARVAGDHGKGRRRDGEDGAAVLLCAPRTALSTINCWCKASGASPYKG